MPGIFIHIPGIPIHILPECLFTSHRNPYSHAPEYALDIKIQADSVNTGSKSKDDKLKGEKCFDVGKNPYITFHSTKITQTSPNAFDVAGTFTLRGISKLEHLTFTVDRDAGGATGEIKGVLGINRKDYGLGGGIRFVTIADRVDVTIDFMAKRVGPPLVFKR